MLKGKRVYIRKIEESDIDKVYRWYQDLDFMRFYSPEELLMTKSNLKEFIAYTVKNNSEDSIRIDFIIEKMDREPIGLADLTGISHRSKHATFSIGIEKNFRNYGYGIEAMILILHFAYSELNLMKVSGHIYKENGDYINQLMKLGIKNEGVLRKEAFFRGKFHDLVYMSILKEEFYKNRLIERIIDFLGCQY